MRLLLYNIRYGLGLGSALHWPFPGMGYSDRQSHQSATNHGLHKVARSRRRWPHRGRHGLDQDAQRQSSGRHRARPGALLRLPVQVRRRLSEPTASHIAQTGQRLPCRSASPRRAISLFRQRHQAPHHRARARRVRDLSRAPFVEVPSSTHTAAALARSRDGIAQAGHCRGRLQHVLGRARDLSVHEGM